MTSPRPPQDPSTPEQALRASALALGGGPDDLQLVTGRPGVGVLALPDEAVRLRVAPLGVDRRQLERVHRLLAAPAMVEAAVAPVPRGLISIVESEGYHVEVTSWADGRDWTNGRVALLSGSAVHRPLPVPAGGLPLLARTVAAAHLATEASAEATLLPFSLRDYAREQRDIWSQQRSRIVESRAREVHLGRWLKAAEKVATGAGAVLDAAGYLEGFPVVAVNRQLWPAHVVADRQRLTLVDWTRAVAGSPLLDIAQIVTHFNGWDTGIVEETLESYAAVRQLTANERRLLPVIACLDLMVETGRLLETAYARRDVRPESDVAESARSGAAASLYSLEALGWAVRPGAESVKPRPGSAPRRPTSPRGPALAPTPRRRGARRPKQ
jgi:hypothetical protein